MDAVYYLNALGYHAFDDYNNTTPSKALGNGWALSDAVWIAVGHALPGQITVENGVSGSPDPGLTGLPGIGAIVADHYVSVSPSYSKGYKAYMYDYPTNYYSGMKLMLFMGCLTGLDGDTQGAFKGNLVKEAYYDMGAKSAVGFRYDIDFPQGTDWMDGFMLSLSNGNNISTAADNARNRVWWDNYPWVTWTTSNTYGFDNPVIYGGTTVIKPAGYAN